MKKEDYIKTWLRNNLSDERYRHSLATAKSAFELAKRYNLDCDKAYLAGLVHDCAKNLDNSKLLDLIKNEIKEGFDKDELKNPKVYHAIAAPYIAKKEFEIDDEEILSAIRKHTTGSIDMSLFDKIIFLADKIEPDTRESEYTKPLYKILDNSDNDKALNEALFYCYSKTIKSLVERKLFIYPVTLDIYNKLLEAIQH